MEGRRKYRRKNYKRKLHEASLPPISQDCLTFKSGITSNQDKEVHTNIQIQNNKLPPFTFQKPLPFNSNSTFSDPFKFGESPIQNHWQSNQAIEKLSSDENRNLLNPKKIARSKKVMSLSAIASISSIVKLHNVAAKTIQKAYCNYKIVRSKKEMQAIEVRGIAFDFLEEIVYCYIKEEVIPDILIEILTADEEELEPEPTVVQVAYEVYTQAKNEIVNEILTTLIKDVLRSLVDDFLQQSNQNSRSVVSNPLEDFVQFLQHEFLHLEMINLVNETIGELVSDYIFYSKYDAFVAEAIEPLITEVASSCINDEICIVNSDVIVDEVTSEEVLVLVESSFAELKCDQEKIARDIEKREILSCAENLIVDNLSLNILFELIAQNGSRILFKESCDHILDQFMASILIDKLVNHQKTLEIAQNNEILGPYNRHYTQNACLNYLLNDLEHQLDLHEKNIHSMEVGENFVEKD